jgi:hypothetical protein
MIVDCSAFVLSICVSNVIHLKSSFNGKNGCPVDKVPVQSMTVNELTEVPG